MVTRTRVRVVDGQLLTNNRRAFEESFYLPEPQPSDDGWHGLSPTDLDLLKGGDDA